MQFHPFLKLKWQCLLPFLFVKIFIFFPLLLDNVFNFDGLQYFGEDGQNEINEFKGSPVNIGDHASHKLLSDIEDEVMVDLFPIPHLDFLVDEDLGLLLVVLVLGHVVLLFLLLAALGLLEPDALVVVKIEVDVVFEVRDHEIRHALHIQDEVYVAVHVGLQNRVVHLRDAVELQLHVRRHVIDKLLRFRILIQGLVRVAVHCHLLLALQLFLQLLRSEFKEVCHQ